VAAGAGCVHFLLYRPNGLLWSLVAFSPLVPLIDRWLPGTRYAWQGTVPAERRETAPAPAGNLVSAPAKSLV
jgi:hypothetical protein